LTLPLILDRQKCLRPRGLKGPLPLVDSSGSSPLGAHPTVSLLNHNHNQSVAIAIYRRTHKRVIYPTPRAKASPASAVIRVVPWEQAYGIPGKHNNMRENSVRLISTRLNQLFFISQ